MGCLAHYVFSFTAQKNGSPRSPAPLITSTYDENKVWPQGRPDPRAKRASRIMSNPGVVYGNSATSPEFTISAGGLNSRESSPFGPGTSGYRLVPNTDSPLTLSNISNTDAVLYLPPGQTERGYLLIGPAVKRQLLDPSPQLDGCIGIPYRLKPKSS